MIPKSQIQRIIDSWETTFVWFELNIIFIFSMQTQLIHNKHEVSFAKIGAKGKPYYAADHIFDKQSMSRLAELSYSRNISFLDIRVSIATDNNKQIHSSAPYISAALSFFSSFFSLICHWFVIQLQNSQGILHAFDRHGLRDKNVAHFIHHGSYCVGLAGCDGIDHVKLHACMLLVRAFL